MRQTTTAIVIDHTSSTIPTVTREGRPAPTRGYSAHLTLDRADTWHHADTAFEAIERALLATVPTAVNVADAEPLRSCGNSTDYHVSYNVAD